MHLMIDFETMGTDPETVVVSLGAVCFNKSGILAEGLYHFDLYEQQKAGRTWNASTLQWWMKQDDDARSVFFDKKIERLSMAGFFEQFETMIDCALLEQGEDRDELKVWGKGADFDNAILKNLYLMFHPEGEMAVPWKFWNGRCFRMFSAMTRITERNPMPGVAHNALDDARYQADCVLKILQKGGKNEHV